MIRYIIGTFYNLLCKETNGGKYRGNSSLATKYTAPGTTHALQLSDTIPPSK